MKRFLFNSALTILLFFSFFGINANICFADKITCEFRENKYGGGEIFLLKYDDNGQNMGYIWAYCFASRDITGDYRQFLNQLNGLTILEDDSRYNQILNLTNRLERLDYNPLMSLAPTSIRDLNSALFRILQSF